jgi:hypothetical protein
MKLECSHEIRINSRRGMIAQVAFALLFCVAFIILEIRYLVLGAVTRVSPITFLTAFSCFVLAIKSRDMLLKMAFALIGIEALARIILAQVHAPYALKHFAAIGGRGLIIVGLLMAIFAIVKWFRSVIRRTTLSEPEGTTS